MADDMPQLHRYMTALLEVAGPRFLQLYETHREDFKKVIGDELEGLAPTSMNLPVDDDERLLNRVLGGFNEIYQSLTCLDTIGIYVRRNPYRRLGVEDAEYLRYHFENYLHEVYLLRERLTRYLGTLRDVYRQSTVGDELLPLLKQMKKPVLDMLEPLTKPRKEHVHDRRVQDPDLRRLSLLQSLSFAAPAFGELHNVVQRDVRKEKIRWMRETTAVIRRRVDDYFAVLNTVLCDEKRSFVEPDAK